MSQTFLSPDEIKKLLRFDPESGKLFWLPRDKSRFKWERSWKAFKTRREGKEALNTPIRANSDCYYLCGRIFEKTYHAHRVAWVLAHGYWPETVDHINGDGTDNRLCNLREATRAENQANLRPHRGKSSGLPKGVTKGKRDRFYVARIRKFGKRIHLGTFKTAEDASAAYIRAAKDINGEFAYHNRVKARANPAER